jgi:zinc protease
MAITDREMPSTVIEVIIKHLHQPLKTAADYRNAIVEQLLNRMLGARYTELSRKAEASFVQGGASVSELIGGLDSYNVNVVAKQGELEQGFKSVWRETERVKRFGFTASELERAKKAHLSAIGNALKEKEKTNSRDYVQEYQEYFLKGIAAPGIAAEYRITKDDLPGITLADVNALAKVFIKSTDRDIIIMAPEKDKSGLPDEIKVTSWIKTIETEKTAPYSDDVNKSTLLNRQPNPGKIVSESQDRSLQTKHFVLSNGVKIILKPTNFKNDEILFNGFAAGGTSVYDDADYQSAANAENIIPAGGIGNYSAGQLDNYLQGRQLSVNPYINERYEGINGGSTKKDLEIALQLIYAYFTEPRKDTAIYKRIIANSKASLLNRNNDPSSVFSDTANAVFGKSNKFRQGLSDL